MARVWVGTSGWRYPPWRGTFYPPGLPQRRELAHLAGLVNSVEINGSFYSLQRPESYRAWAAETPDDFRFAVKGSADYSCSEYEHDEQYGEIGYLAIV